MLENLASGLAAAVARYQRDSRPECLEVRVALEHVVLHGDCPNSVLPLCVVLDVGLVRLRDDCS